MDYTTTEQTEQPVTETPRPPRRPRAARTAANTVRHGILANLPVIPGEERRAEWQAHLQGILTSLQPVGHTEQVLAERIAFQLWRLVRVARYEREAIDVGREGLVEYPDGEILQSPLPGRAVAVCDVLERLQRYEAHLSRELYRAFREFKSLQALRRNAPAERPAALRAQLDQLSAPTADLPALTPAPICPLQSEMPNLQSPGASTTHAQPVPISEPTPALGGRGLGVGRSHSEQQTAAGPIRSAKNYETSHAQTATAKRRQNRLNQPVHKRKRRA